MEKEQLAGGSGAGARAWDWWGLPATAVPGQSISGPAQLSGQRTVPGVTCWGPDTHFTDTAIKQRR